MYCVKDFRTKKDLKLAVKNGEKLRIYSAGIGTPKDNGVEFVEGMHYPTPHSWYAKVDMLNGYIAKVK